MVFLCLLRFKSGAARSRLSKFKASRLLIMGKFLHLGVGHLRQPDFFFVSFELLSLKKIDTR